MKIRISGMGLVTAIGSSVQENFEALKSAKTGISRIELPGNLRKPFLGGEVKLSNEALRNKLGLSQHSMAHRSTLLGLLAAREAWGNNKSDASVRTGIIYGTTIGSINVPDEFLKHLTTIDPDSKLDYFHTHDEYFGTDFIASELGITDFKATISTACSTAANSIMLGARLIRANILDRCLVGGAEAITHYTLNGFDSLQLYDPEICRPFDANRKGLNLGEAGCFLLLEKESLNAKGNYPTRVCLSGWGNACDAYHQTASSPEGKGAFMAIRSALQSANLPAHSIDFINAHGTGTLNNDTSELAALQEIFGAKIPAFSSTKSYTGHTLAAAGGVEAIYTILSMEHGLIFPNLNHMSPIPGYACTPVKNLLARQDLKTGLSNSFGFGGNCTELIFSA